MNYYKTYALVVMWSAIRLIITFGDIFHWALCQVISLWHIQKLPLKKTTTWNFHKASKLLQETPRITSSSSSRIYTVKNKLGTFGILT